MLSKDRFSSMSTTTCSILSMPMSDASFDRGQARASLNLLQKRYPKFRPYDAGR